MNVHDNRILSITSSSEWASDPDRGDRGQPLGPQRGFRHDAKERRAASRDHEEQKRERMVTRTFSIMPLTVIFIENQTGGGEAGATWVRSAIAKELAFDANREGKLRIGYATQFDDIADERPRGRPSLHGEGRCEKHRVRLPIGAANDLDCIAKRDGVSQSTIVQKALDAECARTRNAVGG